MPDLHEVHEERGRPPHSLLFLTDDSRLLLNMATPRSLNHPILHVLTIDNSAIGRTQKRIQIGRKSRVGHGIIVRGEYHDDATAQWQTGWLSGNVLKRRSICRQRYGGYNNNVSSSQEAAAQRGEEKAHHRRRRHHRGSFFVFCHLKKCCQQRYTPLPTAKACMDPVRHSTVVSLCVGSE